jgi:hypothetical protein
MALWSAEFLLPLIAQLPVQPPLGLALAGQAGAEAVLRGGLPGST